MLFSSLLWIDGRNLEPYLLLFTLFLAPAEHWLGHLRWLTVGLTSHILATYISEGILYFAIEEHDASQRLIHARDIGVSYFLVGVMAGAGVSHRASVALGLHRGAVRHLRVPAVHHGPARAELHRDRSLRIASDRAVFLPNGTKA